MAKSKDTGEPKTAANAKIEIETKEKEKKAAKAADAGEAPGDSESKTPGGQEDALKTAQDNLTAEKDKYLRLAAEYDNFRKRSAKERDSIYANAKADVIGKLLPVYDNLERALKLECSDEAYYKGIEMTMLQLTEILGGLGVRPVPTTGEPFDPNRHNAVARIENPDLGGGIIAEECKKGFTMGERIIRFADVVVAN